MMRCGYHSSEELPSSRDEAPSWTYVGIANLLMTAEGAMTKL